MIVDVRWDNFFQNSIFISVTLGRFIQTLLRAMNKNFFFNNLLIVQREESTRKPAFLESRVQYFTSPFL